MVICSLDALKKSWKKKEMRIENEIVEMCNKLMTIERKHESKTLE